jgi:hypothetical protein
MEDEETKLLGRGASVVKVQVALDSDWAEQGNIMEALARLSDLPPNEHAYDTSITERR